MTILSHIRSSNAKPAWVLAGALLCGAASLSGCSPVGVAVGAGAAAGSVALEERGFKQGMRDRAAEASIATRLFEQDLDTFGSVNVEVVENRVLLTGEVPTPDNRITAVRAAWAEEGVVDVINEITIGDSSGLDDAGQDLNIATTLRTKITFDSQVKAVNYSIEVVNGTIYLFGIAQNEQELRRVVALAREIPYVRRIVTDYVVMKDDPSRRTSR